MAFSLDNCRKLTLRYENLPPDEQAVIEMMAVYYVPAAYKQLLKCCSVCQIRSSSGKSHSQPTLRAVIKGLQQKKLVAQVSGKGMICNRDVVEVITRRIVTRGDFEKLSQDIVKACSSYEFRWQYYESNPDVLLRKMRIAFYTHDLNQVRELYEKRYYFQPGFTSQSFPLIGIVAHPFDVEFIETLPSQMVIWVVDILYSHQLYYLEAIPGYFDYLEQQCLKTEKEQQTENAHAFQFIIGMLLIFRGRIREAKAMAKNVSDEMERLSILGITTLLLGDGEGAVSYFEEGLTEYKKRTKKRKPFFKTIDSLFYLMALVKMNTQESLQKASEYVTLLERSKETPFAQSGINFRFLVELQKGLPPEKILFFRYDEGIPFLLSAMAMYLVDSEVLKNYGRQLEHYLKAAEACEFAWVAGEMKELLGRLNGSQSEKDNNCKQARAMRESSGTVSLADLVVRQAPWERMLKALAAIQIGEEKKKTAQSSRVVWRLEQRYDGWDIYPYIQKLSAKGKWSNGRAIALDRLWLERDSMPFLTAQDKEICSCIERESGYGSHYSYHRDYYDFSSGVFPALAGHPLVFWKDAPKAQVEIVKGEVALRVSRKGDKIAVELTPLFSEHDSVIVLMESYNRVVVYEISEQQRYLAKVLEQGVQAPADAEHQVAEVLGNVASCITVQSDISNVAVQLPEVPADTQPEVLLLPYEDGLRAQMMVRPLEKGSYYMAGEGGEVVLAELEGQRVQARRDFAEERKRANVVIEACPTLTRVVPVVDEWLIPEPELALELLLELQGLGDQVRVSWPKGERMRVTRNVSAEDFRMSISSGVDWFSMKGQLHLDDALVFDMRRLLEHVASSSSRFVPLGDGQFLALTRAFQKRLQELRVCSEERGDSLRFHPLATAALEEFAEEAGNLKTDRKWKAHLKHLREVQEYAPALPDTLRVELRDYQKEGFQWLARLAHWGVGACLADDMGLGKTIEALALLVARATEGPSLVVAPTSVCTNWIDETRRFAPTLKAHLFGSGDRKELLDAVASFDLVVCSYGLMQQEEELFTAIPWNVIVLDEAQAIKNRTTKRSKVAMKLQGAFKLIATGTPIENHLGELWNLFRFINPGLLGSFERFNTRFAAPIERDQDRETRTRLKRLIQPFVLRRVKEQVLEELPSRTEITLRVELSKEEAAFYEALRQEAVATLEGDAEPAGQKHLRILAQIMKLRRACCNTALVSPDISLPSAKIEVFGAIVDELLENRHKALVFSQFVDHLSLIREYLDKKKITYQYLDGATTGPQRKKRVDAFQSGEGDLFLISLKAGGLGINLTAADYVIHMDPWWNPAVEDQASDRSHRIGQERPVTIYRLVAQDTIEEKIVTLHQKKRGLADSLLEGTDMTGKMNAEELLELLRESSAS